MQTLGGGSDGVSYDVHVGSLAGITGSQLGPSPAQPWPFVGIGE